MIEPDAVAAAIRLPRAEEAWEPVLFGGMIPIIGAVGVLWLIRHAIKEPPEDAEQKRVEEQAAEQLRLAQEKRAGPQTRPPDEFALSLAMRRKVRTRAPQRYLMKSISSYFGSGQRSSATTFSSLSPTSRTLLIAAS
ncbi:MAG: hypothetical protein QM729_16675 [Solirubrobacterales bacterium]